MNIHELRLLQERFEGNRLSNQKTTVHLEELRREFVVKFSLEELKKMPLEKYVVGDIDKKKDSFCYWLETKLLKLGNFKGATAFKFGIYYGKTKSEPEKKYRFRPGLFGNYPGEVYANVKKAILELLDAGRDGDVDAIEQSKLSPMFKGKILATYYPDKYLNVFAGEHLDFFIEKLGVGINSVHSNEVRKRMILMDFKNADNVMRSWTNYEFSKFLYEQIGRPFDAELTNEALRDYILPPFIKVRATFIDLKLAEIRETLRGAPRSYKLNYEENNRRNAMLGKRGEDVVFDEEIKKLRNSNHDNLKALSDKVKHISLIDDSKGFDIQSFDENGKEKYIEVKSTRSDIQQFSFVMSGRELEKAKELKDAYYIYIVFKADSLEPKIYSIINPFNSPESVLKLMPVNFRVLINPQ